MLNKIDYDRLTVEYINAYNRNCSHAHDVTKFFAWFTVGVIVLTAITVAVALYPPFNAGSVVILVIMPPTAAGLIAVGAHEKNKWDKTAELIKTAASYECTITDCGGYVKQGGKNPNTHVVFKFVYNKDGSEVTDMCRLWFGGVYKGDLPQTRITLYETGGGGKVISVTPPDKGEYRLIY